MGYRVYGVAAAETQDREGETLLLKGLDTSGLSFLNDEHSDNLGRIIGAITKQKKIFSERDIEDERQRQCWNVVKAPLLYIEGELATDEDHSDAKDAAALIKFAHKLPNSPLRIGFSVEGSTLERGGPDEKTLTKTSAYAVSLTAKPANPKCVLFPEISLAKSFEILDPPARYWKALQQPEQKKSFIEVPKHLILQNKLMTLKKSLDDYWAAFTHISCKKCGQPTRFFKSSSDLPNGCCNCGNHFSMAEIWKALNR